MTKVIAVTSFRFGRVASVAVFVTALMGIVQTTANVRADDDIQNKEKSIDPYGRPLEFIQGKKRMYGLWYEDGVWKLRTTSGKGVRVGFHGTVEVDGDKVTPDYTALEGVRRSKDSDRVVLSRNQRQMKFRFITIGWTDGIDFKVGPKAKTVKFDFRIAGDDDPRGILIGAKGVHPEKSIFTLPAHPVSASVPKSETPAK